jgi:hypothetical protein
MGISIFKFYTVGLLKEEILEHLKSEGKNGC